MCSKRLFNVKDKVFATTSGYPPWPALITDIVINSSFKLRYNVYFYGTGGYSLCKSKQLVPYQKNKLKFSNPEGKLDLLQQFAKALLEIENDTDSLGYTIDNGSTCNINNIQEQESSSDELDKISDIFKEIKTKCVEKKRIKGQPNLRKKKHNLKPSGPKMSKKNCSTNEDVFTTSNNINSSHQKSSLDNFENINQVEEINPSNLEGKRKIEVKEDSSLSKKQKQESRKGECVISNQIHSDLSHEDIQEFTTSIHINNTNHQLYPDKLKNNTQVEGINQSNLEGKEQMININRLNLFKIKKKKSIKRTGDIISKVISPMNSNKDAQVFTTLSNINDSKQIQSQDQLVSINEVAEINQSTLEGEENIKEESSFIEKQNIISTKHILDVISKEVYSNQSDEDIQEFTTSSHINNTNQQSSSDGNAVVDLLKTKVKFFIKKKKNKDKSNFLKINKEPIKIRSSNILNFKSEKGAQLLKISDNINYLKQRSSQDKLVTINETSEINQPNLEGDKNIKFKEESSLPKNNYLSLKKNKTGCFIIEEICSDQSDEDTQELKTLINYNNKNQQSFSDQNQSNLEEKEKTKYIDESNLLKNTMRPNILNIESVKDAQVFTTSSNLSHSKQSPSQDKLETFSDIADITQFTLDGEEKVKQQTSLSIKQNIASKTNKHHVITKEIFSDQFVEDIHEFTTSSNFNFKNQKIFSNKLKNDNKVDIITQSDLEIEEKIINKNESNLINIRKNVPLKKRSHNTSEIISNIKYDKDAQVFTTSSNNNYSKEIEYKDKLAPINEVLDINQSDLECIEKIKDKKETSSVEKQNFISTKNTLDVISKEICNKTDENMIEFVPLSNINNNNHQSFIDNLKTKINQFKGITQFILESKEIKNNNDESNLINIKKKVPLKKRRPNTCGIIPNTKSENNAQVFTTPCHTSYSKSIPSQDKEIDIAELDQSNLESIGKIKFIEETSAIEKQNHTLSKNILDVISKETCSDKTNENIHECIPLSNINNTNHQLNSDYSKNINQVEQINKSNLEVEEKVMNNDELNLLKNNNRVQQKIDPNRLYVSKVVSNVKSDKSAQVVTLSSNSNYSKEIESQDNLASPNEVLDINQFKLESIENIKVKKQSNLLEKQHQASITNKLNTISKETCNQSNEDNMQEFNLDNDNDTNHQSFSDNLESTIQFEGINQSNIDIDEKIKNKNESNLINKKKNLLLNIKNDYTSKVISIIRSAEKHAQVFTIPSNHKNNSKSISFPDKLVSTNEIAEIHQSNLECMEKVEVNEKTNSVEKQNLTLSKNILAVISKETSSDKKNIQEVVPLSNINNTNHQLNSDNLKNINQVEQINKSNLEVDEKVTNNDESNLLKNNNRELQKTGPNGLYVSKVVSNVKSDKSAQVVTSSSNSNYSKEIESQDNLASPNEVLDINQFKLESIENIKVKEQSNLLEKQNQTSSKNIPNVISKEICDQSNMDNMQAFTLRSINNTNHQSFPDKLKYGYQFECIHQSHLEGKEKIINIDESNLINKNKNVPLKKRSHDTSKVISNIKHDKYAQEFTISCHKNYLKSIPSPGKLESINEIAEIDLSNLECRDKVKTSSIEKQNLTLSKNIRDVFSKEICSDKANENIHEFIPLSNNNNTNHQMYSDNLNNISQVERINKSNLKVDEKLINNDEFNLLKNNNRVLGKRTGLNGLYASKVVSNVKSDKGAQVVSSSSDSNYSNEIESQDNLASPNEVLDVNQFKLESIENNKVKDKLNLLEKQNQASSKNMPNVISKEVCSDRSNENIEELILSSLDNTNHQLNSDKLKNNNIGKGINKSNLEIDEKIKTNDESNLIKNNYRILQIRTTPYGPNSSKAIPNVKSDKGAKVVSSSSDSNYSKEIESQDNLDKIQKISDVSPVFQNIKKNHFHHIPSEKSYTLNNFDEKLKYTVSVQLEKLSDYFIAKALGKQPIYAAYYIVNAEGQLIKTSGPSVESSDMIINSCNDSKPMTANEYIHQMNSSNNENTNYVSCSGDKNKLNTCTSTSKKQIVDNDKFDHSQEHSSKTKDITDLDTERMIYEKAHETNADYRKLSKAQVELEINIMRCLKILITNLEIKNFNYRAAITALDRLHEFKFTTLILLKYKIILDTISKVSEYCISNVNEPISSEQERIIRYKAQTLFNVLVSLFTVSPGQTFEKVYNKELKDFSKKTEHMKFHQIIEYTQYSDLL